MSPDEHSGRRRRPPRRAEGPGAAGPRLHLQEVLSQTRLIFTTVVSLFLLLLLLLRAPEPPARPPLKPPCSSSRRIGAASVGRSAHRFAAARGGPRGPHHTELRDSLIRDSLTASGRGKPAVSESRSASPVVPYHTDSRVPDTRGYRESRILESSGDAVSPTDMLACIPNTPTGLPRPAAGVRSDDSSKLIHPLKNVYSSIRG